VERIAFTAMDSRTEKTAVKKEKVIWDVNVSLDGFIAKPDDSPGRLFDWYFKGDKESAYQSDKYPFKLSEDDVKIFDGSTKSIGAVVAGRRTYDSTKGWRASYYNPVPMFIVTHNVPQVVPEGKTKFTFVTDGIESAIKQAKTAADGKAVNLLGANVAKQVMEAWLLDEFHVHIAPFFLGDGIRLYDRPGSQQVQFERISVVVSSSGWTHMEFKLKNLSSEGSSIENLRKEGAPTRWE
jgi:dihydrofolate reductase